VVSRAEATTLGVTVPDEAGDAVRLVEAEGFDLQACGGTHPRTTSEVGVVVVLVAVQVVEGGDLVVHGAHRVALLDPAAVLVGAPLLLGHSCEPPGLARLKAYLPALRADLVTGATLTL